MAFATKMIAALAGALLVVAGAGCGAQDPAASERDDFDSRAAMADLRAQVAIGPRPAGSAAARRNAELIAHTLEEAGVEDVRVQRPWRNVVGTIPGRQEGAVVVGAHHDTYDIPGFVGANDGASGVAVVLGLARALAGDAPLSGRSLRLVLFDAEEARPGREFVADGMRGSRQYVRYARAGGRQGAAPLAEIDAMVLFDLVGDCEQAIPREASSDAGLYAEFQRAARELNGTDSPAPFEGEAPTVLDDHTPFLEAGIPAVDLIDFDYGPGAAPGAWWHTTEDTLDRVCESSLDAVGEAALIALPRIGR